MAALIIGIAGGTGSGKTTVTRKIAEGIPPHGVAVIEHDSYYRDRSHMAPEERVHVNFDHPDALETDLLVEHLGQLRRGEGVELPVYDFASHTRKAETLRLEPRPVILVEGILTFVDERLRALFDMKIFVDTDADIRLMRRIRRDIEERGRDFESVREQYYATVRPMHLQFVEPSKRHADIVIPEGGDNHVALDLVIGKARSVVGQV
ncbi:MAG: uridine kinase [Polyangiales bacterium]